MIRTLAWWAATFAVVGYLVKINPKLLVLRDYKVETPIDFIPGPFANHQMHPIQTVGGPTFNYRGDVGRNGHSLEVIRLPLELKWSFGTLNLGIHGASKTSPAVDEQGVVIGADTSWLYSFDLQGKLQWKFFAGNSDRGIHSTAVLTKDHVFFGAYNGRAYALDRRTGKPLWVTALGQTIGASPVLHHGDLYWSVEIFNPPDGYLVKMDAKTGQVIWRSELLGEQSHSSPTIDSDHAMVFAGDNKSQMTAFDLRTGEKLWRYPTLGPVKGTASWWKNHLYFTDWGRSLYKLNSLTGQLLWSFPLKGRSQSSVTILADNNLGVFAASDKTIYAVDLATGESRWQIPTENDEMQGSFTAGVQSGTGRPILIGPCFRKQICVLAAATGQILQRVDVGSSVSSVPTLFNGQVFIATDLTGLQVYE